MKYTNGTLAFSCGSTELIILIFNGIEPEQVAKRTVSTHFIRAISFELDVIVVMVENISQIINRNAVELTFYLFS